MRWLYKLVPGAGLEPARSFLRGILSPLCLPIPPPGLYHSVDIVIAFNKFNTKCEAEVGIEPA